MEVYPVLNRLGNTTYKEMLLMTRFRARMDQQDPNRIDGTYE
jgi:hypothetical protein